MKGQCPNIGIRSALNIFKILKSCSLPCEHGECLDLRHEQSLDYTNGYFCHCEPGWSGLYCHIPVEPVETEPKLYQCPGDDEIEIPQNAICDNIVDCPNGQDENGIMAECVVEKTRDHLADKFEWEKDYCCTTFMVQGRECKLEQAAGVDYIYSCGDSEHTFFWIQRSRAAWLFHSSGSKKVFHFDWTEDGFQMQLFGHGNLIPLSNCISTSDLKPF